MPGFLARLADRTLGHVATVEPLLGPSLGAAVPLGAGAEAPSLEREEPVGLDQPSELSAPAAPGPVMDIPPIVAHASPPVGAQDPPEVQRLGPVDTAGHDALPPTRPGPPTVEPAPVPAAPLAEPGLEGPSPSVEGRRASQYQESVEGRPHGVDRPAVERPGEAGPDRTPRAEQGPPPEIQPATDAPVAGPLLDLGTRRDERARPIAAGPLPPQEPVADLAGPTSGRPRAPGQDDTSPAGPTPASQNPWERSNRPQPERPLPGLSPQLAPATAIAPAHPERALRVPEEPGAAQDAPPEVQLEPLASQVEAYQAHGGETTRPRAAEPQGPDVRVTIGRVEVRANVEAQRPATPAPRVRRQPALSLAGYLARRSEGPR